MNKSFSALHLISKVSKTSKSCLLAAIKFTDIVGYTALMGMMKKDFELLRKNSAIQKPVIEEFGGQWIVDFGDVVIAIFQP